MENEFISFTISKQKNIALIAHDSKKKEMIEWCSENKDILQRHFLCGTGTTGGDQQIGAKIVEGKIDLVIFFSDPLAAQPHDPDVKALLRIAQVYDIPIANNRSTADFIVHSEYMNEEYVHKVMNFHKNIEDRVNSMK